jgi:hypothetical protein
MEGKMSGGIRLVAVIVFVFSIYFIFRVPLSIPRSPGESEQFIKDGSHEAPPPEPTYDLASLPRIEVGQAFEFGLDKDNRALLAGWSVPEPGGIWSLGKDASIGFLPHCEPSVCAKDDAALLFEGMVFVVPKHPQQRIEVWVGERKVDQVTLSTTMIKFATTLDKVPIEDGAPIILTLHFVDAIAQAKVTNSNDPREIAFRIGSLRLGQ